jgi:hypothetical protein
MQEIEIYAKKVEVDFETGQTFIKGFDINALVSEFSVKEILDAIAENGSAGDIADWVWKNSQGEDE